MRSRVAPALTLVLALACLAARADAATAPPQDPAAQNALLVSRINDFRATAGLAALTADPLIGQAALGHSTYWTLNSTATATQPGGLHQQTPGNPGFTGTFPPDRCAAAGTSCGTEVIAPGSAGTAAVELLMDTVYHRQALLSSTTVTAGGAWAANNMTTIDLGGARPNPLISPSGFPIGQWDGPLAMVGESPDPIGFCNAQSSAPPITAPVGAPVTFELPASATATAIAITDLNRDVSVAGCSDLATGTFHSFFIPDDPLAPLTTYQVALSWRPAAAPISDPPQITTWTFATSTGPPPPPAFTPFPPSPPFSDPGSTPTIGSVRPDNAAQVVTKVLAQTLRLSRTHIRSGQPLVVRYQAAAAGTVTATVTRPANGRANTSRLPRVTRHVKHGSGSVSVSTKRLRAGAYRVRVTLRTTRETTLSARIRVLEPARRRTRP